MDPTDRRQKPLSLTRAELHTLNEISQRVPLVVTLRALMEAYDKPLEDSPKVLYSSPSRPTRKPKGESDEDSTEVRGSGYTRRTAFRKARKGLSNIDPLKPEFRTSVKVLIRLCLRHNRDFSESLPVKVKIPGELLKELLKEVLKEADYSRFGDRSLKIFKDPAEEKKD